MNPATKATVRSSTRVKQVVRSTASMRQLEASLRRLGVDDATVATITGGASNGRGSTSA